jgi:hypothetical protein
MPCCRFAGRFKTMRALTRPDPVKGISSITVWIVVPDRWKDTRGAAR